MCMQTITETLDGSVTMIESGWKHFSRVAGELKFEAQKLGNSNTVATDKWLDAGDQKEISANSGKLYKPGFHIFTDEKKAKSSGGGYSTHRVYFRRPTYLGTDRSTATVIAQEMYVPSDQDAWPPKEK